MSDNVFKNVGKTATTGSSALVGGGVGAALGTAICPGPGTAIGYLAGITAGCVSGLKIAQKLFNKY